MTSRTNANPTGRKSGVRDRLTPQNHQQRRRQAIARYLAGDKIDHICHQMGCSKSWLYKWLHRYRTNQPDWEHALTTRPRRQPAQSHQDIEPVVLAIRQDLRQKGHGYGATAIQRELNQQGLAPIPAKRTIYRMVRRSENQATSRAPQRGATPKPCP